MQYRYTSIHLFVGNAMVVPQLLHLVVSMSLNFGFAKNVKSIVPEEKMLTHLKSIYSDTKSFVPDPANVPR